MPDAAELKKRAALEALTFVSDGFDVGLGSGSTAALFIAELGRRLRDGQLKNIRGIPTSSASEQLAKQAGVPLVDFSQCQRLAVTIDGADEVAPDLSLVKGLGGALLREKIVAQNSDKLVIIADSAKRVPHLGARTSLPVEVLPFGHECLPAFFRSIDGEPVLRLSGAEPLVTDNGNFIYDVAFGRIDKPHELEARLLRRAGVVQTGLFLGMADVVLIAGADGVERLER